MSYNQTYDENKLLRSLIEGDEQAYTLVYHHHLDAIFYFIRNYIFIEQDAEDLTSSVFQKLWLQRATLDPARPLRPWLYTVARNLCLNHLKLSQRRTAREAEALRILHTGEENEFAAHEFMEELMREIESSLKKLPPQTANIFTMAFLEGRSNQEIANLLQINEHTVRNQKSQALKQLRLSFRSWILFCQLF
ncbi:MAG: sigma-70 family RNA polymerase sigma factor [Chitinophagaceae bacterium]|nr:sigma-70 family RNA polymerase sigma factor [Chitinophagaceae bacterium]